MLPSFFFLTKSESARRFMNEDNALELIMEEGSEKEEVIIHPFSDEEDDSDFTEEVSCSYHERSTEFRSRSRQFS